MNNELLEIKNDYVFYGSMLNDCTSKTKSRKHNKAMGQLSILYHKAETMSDKSFYLELLDNEMPKIRTIVAAHCLGLGIYLDKAQEVLKEIAEYKNDPIMAFEAKATLEVWEKRG